MSSPINSSAALAFALIAALSTACPQSIGTSNPNAGDASSDDANRDAGSLDPVDTGTGTNDTGTGTDDAGARDADPPDTAPPDTGAPLRPLNWGEMSLPANTASVMAIWGRSSNEIYAGTSNGNVMQFDPTNGWTVVWHEPNNFGIRSIGGTPTKIFIASETTFYVHNGSISQSPTALSVGRSIYDMHVAADNSVYLVSDQQNGRGLYRYDGMRIVTMSEPTTIATLASVHVLPSGGVFVGGNGAILRYEAATLTPETVEWPVGFTQSDILNFTFYELASVGNRFFAAGDRFLIFERDSGGTWRGVHLPLLTDDIHGIVGFERGADTEVYAAGGSSSQGSLVRYYENQWMMEDPFMTDLDLWGIWASGPDEYFICGNISNMIRGVILRGTR